MTDPSTADTPTDDGAARTDDSGNQSVESGNQSVDSGNRLEFADAVELETTKAHLWETISDPETLTACVPGADSIERLDERTYTLEITRGISHVSVSLSGEAEFVEMNPPDFIVTRGTAFDSKTGTDFEVLAAMELEEAGVGEEGDGVSLAYQAEVTFSGGAAVMKKSLLRPIVKRDVNTYFENVRARVEDGN